MTTLGIAVNLVTYLTGTMHLGNAASANVVTNFLGTSFMLCLLGGFVADTYLGRYPPFPNSMHRQGIPKTRFIVLILLVSFQIPHHRHLHRHPSLRKHFAVLAFDGLVVVYELLRIKQY